MLAGMGVSLYYLAVNLEWSRQLLGVTRPLAECRWFGLDPVVAGAFGVPAGMVAPRCW